MCFCFVGFPLPGEWGWRRPSEMEQPRSHRRGQAGGQGSSPRASSSPPACRCRGFVVVAGLRFGLKALAHSHVLLEVASAAASPLQANKTLCDQKDPAILYPYVHPARSRGVLALDVLASCICCWPSAVLGQTGNAGLYPCPVLPCCQASRTRQRPSLCACLHRDCGAHGGPRALFLPPETLQLSLIPPCLRSAGERGSERPRCWLWVPVARGSALFPSVASSFPPGRSWDGPLPA